MKRRVMTRAELAEAARDNERRRIEMNDRIRTRMEAVNCDKCQGRGFYVDISTPCDACQERITQ